MQVLRDPTKVGTPQAIITELEASGYEKPTPDSDATVVEPDRRDPSPIDLSLNETTESTNDAEEPSNAQPRDLKEESSESSVSTLSEDQDDASQATLPKINLQMLQLDPFLDLKEMPIDDIAELCDHALAHARTYKLPATVRLSLRDRLLAYGQAAFVEVATDPPKWLAYAVLLHSEVLFREAAIHIIGCWPSWPWETTKDVIDGVVLKMIERKSNSLRTQRLEINQELFLATINLKERGEWVPATFLLGSEVSLVIATFDEWLRNQLRELRDPHTLEIDQTQIGALYRTIHSLNEYLLPEKLMKVFGDIRVNFPCEPKELCESITILKGTLAEVVQDVVRNNLMLHIEEHPDIQYLTCAEITKADIPWKASNRGLAGQKWTASASTEPGSKRQRTA